MNKIILLLIMLACYGCVITKVVSVPLRVGAAAVSVVPWAGDKNARCHRYRCRYYRRYSAVMSIRIKTDMMPLEYFC